MNESSARPVAASATRVLIVDDNPYILGFLSVMLARAGFDVLTAENGREALRQFAAHHPAVVVTDLHMPEENGFELIADLQRLAPEVPIVAVTGEGCFDEAVSGQAAGCIGADLVLGKPFGSQELIAALRRVLASRRGPSA
jgi:DNA-binding response OmpR family regulator